MGSNPTSTAIHGLRLVSGRRPPRGVVVLEPQGTLFLILLLLAFGGLITWVALAGQVVFRVIAACLAFIPAMVFGIFAVNKYYDYYQTWGALYSDLSGQTTSIPHLTAAGLGKGTAGSLKSLIGTVERLPDRRAVRAALQRRHHRPPHPHQPEALRLPAAAVLPEGVRELPVPRHRAAARLARRSVGVGERDERGPDLPERDGQRQGQARPSWSCRTPTAASSTGCSASTTRAASRT